MISCRSQPLPPVARSRSATPRLTASRLNSPYSTIGVPAEDSLLTPLALILTPWHGAFSVRFSPSAPDRAGELPGVSAYFCAGEAAQAARCPRLVVEWHRRCLGTEHHGTAVSDGERVPAPPDLKPGQNGAELDYERLSRQCRELELLAIGPQIDVAHRWPPRAFASEPR